VNIDFGPNTQSCKSWQHMMMPPVISVPGTMPLICRCGQVKVRIWVEEIHHPTPMDVVRREMAREDQCAG
jgi:hypothetical protein